jgi:hypothetical protein
VAIFIYPRLTLAPRAFDAFAARLRESEQEARGGRALYVAATFHPDYPFDARSAAALVPFLRRSPDPSIQWIRLEVVEQAREGHGKFLFDFSPAAWAELERRRDHPSVTDRIGADNQKRVADLGRDHFEAIYQAIRDDRARTYGATATSGGERRR